ncbi:aldose 1-epimerase family protein [Pelomonas sp. KK5]|uniref:aldose 1-epimerase family protein n=1 Tax=Pelomonas sp. KK5 TaxID=1855730 RepID=UPI00097C8907|nr:aldose 1-epimerase family protein [Pelomonas sp. KK5]
MPRLFGRDWSRRELAAQAGQLGQYAGVQLLTLGDGAGRGLRCLEFRTGTGLAFRVLVDRAFDIGPCEFRGASLGWQSPTGLRHPGLHENADEDGLGWLRSFSGLHVTCGLDHTLGPELETAAHYHHPHRQAVRQPLHGRIANTPARLTGHGERWDGDECVLWAEGEVRQAAVFGENLCLYRRVEARVGGNTFSIRDRVVNEGFSTTPHMLMYHINLGHPLLDAGSRYVAPVRHTRWAAHAGRLREQGVGSVTQGGPQPGFVEQVFEHAMAAGPDGRIPMGLVNPGFDGGHGLGLAIEVDAREFPCHLQWQNLRSGLYTMAIEPSTNHAPGKQFARERGELIQLAAGEERRYGVDYTVLDGSAEIERFERRIASLAPHPQQDYPTPTGRWDD